MRNYFRSLLLTTTSLLSFATLGAQGQLPVAVEIKAPTVTDTPDPDVQYVMMQTDSIGQNTVAPTSGGNGPDPSEQIDRAARLLAGQIVQKHNDGHALENISLNDLLSKEQIRFLSELSNNQQGWDNFLETLNALLLDHIGLQANIAVDGTIEEEHLVLTDLTKALIERNIRGEHEGHAYTYREDASLNTAPENDGAAEDNYLAGVGLEKLTAMDYLLTNPSFDVEMNGETRTISAAELYGMVAADYGYTGVSLQKALYNGAKGAPNSWKVLEITGVLLSNMANFGLTEPEDINGHEISLTKEQKTALYDAAVVHNDEVKVDKYSHPRYTQMRANIARALGPNGALTNALKSNSVLGDSTTMSLFGMIGQQQLLNDFGGAIPAAIIPGEGAVETNPTLYLAMTSSSYGYDFNSFVNRHIDDSGFFHTKIMDTSLRSGKKRGILKAAGVMLEALGHDDVAIENLTVSDVIELSSFRQVAKIIHDQYPNIFLSLSEPDQDKFKRLIRTQETVNHRLYKVGLENADVNLTILGDFQNSYVATGSRDGVVTNVFAAGQRVGRWQYPYRMTEVSLVNTFGLTVDITDLALSKGGILTPYLSGNALKIDLGSQAEAYNRSMINYAGNLVSGFSIATGVKYEHATLPINAGAQYTFVIDNPGSYDDLSIEDQALRQTLTPRDILNLHVGADWVKMIGEQGATIGVSSRIDFNWQNPFQKGYYEVSQKLTPDQELQYMIINDPRQGALKTMPSLAVTPFIISLEAPSGLRAELGVTYAGPTGQIGSIFNGGTYNNFDIGMQASVVIPLSKYIHAKTTDVSGYEADYIYAAGKGYDDSSYSNTTVTTTPSDNTPYSYNMSTSGSQDSYTSFNYSSTTTVTPDSGGELIKPSERYYYEDPVYTTERVYNPVNQPKPAFLNFDFLALQKASWAPLLDSADMRLPTLNELGRVTPSQFRQIWDDRVTNLSDSQFPIKRDRQGNAIIPLRPEFWSVTTTTTEKFPIQGHQVRHDRGAVKELDW